MVPQATIMEGCLSSATAKLVGVGRPSQGLVGLVVVDAVVDVDLDLVIDLDKQLIVIERRINDHAREGEGPSRALHDVA